MTKNLETPGTRAWFEEEFRHLPEEWERSYEKEIVRLSLSDREEAIRPVLEEILRDETANEDLRYAAYCTLHSRYRRMRDHQKLKVLTAQYEEWFRNHPSAEHFSLLSYVDMGDRIDGESVLLRAEQSITLMRETAGSLHLLADLTARYYEENPQLLTAAPEQAKEWLGKAIRAVEAAIAKDNYAKFHYTKARLLSLQGQHEQALKELEIAMDREDSGRADYAIRMATYMSEKIRIAAMKREEDLRLSMQDYITQIEKKQDDAEKNIEAQMGKLSDSTVKNLEFLGLFAGIISFTVGGISIVSGASAFSFRGAAGLLIVLMGALLEVFCGFGVALHGLGKEKEYRYRNLVVCGFGLAMIALGLFLCEGL